ncbi:tRNA modification GTPase [Mucisphaera calidilacus]|uniref:tRNA modification GTPase MnmE n=1 Tax=Mucisphaera calidilacus TaxID=2527982 RepID=A0A518BVH0_9BACT|nr:GTPase [Mucisphaera calidilacus]QDU70982.1 tRNA modification GTPase MnmE [Mucisphaera calidilacus]
MSHPANDTIVATASPVGPAARGMIRLSGPDAHAILARLCTPPDKPRQLADTRLKHTDLPPIPARVCAFRASGSYTGEPAAELWLPGNPSLLERTLHAATAAGARLAEPGEFSYRAFRNGRLTLEQAEGVSATIAADNDHQLEAATTWRQGRLGQTVDNWMHTLADTLALVEAGIDFTDQDDVVAIPAHELAERINTIHHAVRTLHDSGYVHREHHAQPRVVLAGPPSAGKSTLMNALLGHHRAVTHHAPGTTRDRLEAPLDLTHPDGHTVSVILVDLAGLDDTPDHGRDAEAQFIAREALEDADLILRCVPADDAQPVNLPEDANHIDVRTKADLAQHPHDDHALPVCGLTGNGLEALRSAIAGHLAADHTTRGSARIALQPRHQHALHATLTTLGSLLDQIGPDPSDHRLTDPELVADTIRQALDHLGSIAGRISEDDVIGRLFAQFCIGK